MKKKMKPKYVLYFSVIYLSGSDPDVIWQCGWQTWVILSFCVTKIYLIECSKYNHI